MKKEKDEPAEKARRGKLASADTMPAVQPARTPRSPSQARYTVSDTMPIPEVPEPQLPPGNRDSVRQVVMPSGMHERGKLGRFDILDILGQGGMGVVIAAYDPQLDRKVAIKVLRTRGLTGRRRDKEAARLLREAQTMAKLSHPHVITVFEAGEIDDRVYIAMEYVAGQTLRSWLDESPRSVLEILDAYIKAGRGLAAGHNAGLIHRDFKPDNVLVGFDGRVRVIDFGLARPTRAQHDTPSPFDDSGEVSEPVGTPSPLHMQLTTAGSLFGTPIYMSPEQHDKQHLDGRADQFAFCVALYEALYQDLPFAAGSYAELAFNVTKGNLKLPPERADIPKRVVDAIVRGLEPDPEERFPAMDALLDELEPPAKQLNRTVLVALAGVAAVAIALVVVLLVARESASEKVPPCLDGPQRLAGVWNDGVKAKMKAAFQNSGRSHADETFKRVVETIDTYSAAWVADRRKVCEATKVLEEQSESLFDLRMKCTNDRLAELDTIGEAFAAADAQVVDHALAAIRELRSSTNCVGLMLNVAPPTVAQEPKLDKLRLEFFKVKTNNLLGRYDIAAPLAQATSAKANQIGYAPFTALVEHAHGVALSGSSRWVEAESSLRRALESAARAKDDRMLAAIWTSLITVIAMSDAKRFDEALAIESVADLAIRRADNDATLRGELLYAIASMQMNKGNYEKAAAAVDAGLALPEGALDATGISHFHNIRGLMFLRMTNLMGAREAFQKALASSRAALGDNHPDVAIPLSSLGALAQAMGNWDEARKFHTQALKIMEETRGPGHEQTGLVVYSLAISANGRNDFKSALPLYQRALAIFEKLSPTHPQIGLALVGVADSLEELGQAKEAVPYGERALELVAASTDVVQVAMARFILAKALWGANMEKPRARKLAEQAREGFKAGGFGAVMGLAAVEKWFTKIDGKK